MLINKFKYPLRLGLLFESKQFFDFSESLLVYTKAQAD